jgi:hypothetical protein
MIYSAHRYPGLVIASAYRYRFRRHAIYWDQIGGAVTQDTKSQCMPAQVETLWLREALKIHQAANKTIEAGSSG